ncbi:MAG TPA: phosphopantetheine-binding protein [Pyrinomonadaceae bacterium]|nr:phosphopantetheine-binding protein [Pyrinomonadaceae bacterium]
MALPQPVTDFLKESAANAGVSPPVNGEDLFKTGVLDSFALVDFVTLLESTCDIKIPDSDVVAINFQTLAAIENYLVAHQG